MGPFDAYFSINFLQQSFINCRNCWNFLSTIYFAVDWWGTFLHLFYKQECVTYERRLAHSASVVHYYLDSRPTTDGLELDWNKQITSGAKYSDKSTLSMHFIKRSLSLYFGLILDGWVEKCIHNHVQSAKSIHKYFSFFGK